MAANKPTAVHYVLILFVVTNILAIVAAYMLYDDYKTQTADLKAAKDGEQKATNAAKSAQSQVTQLKSVMGYQEGQVINPENRVDPTTVIGRALRDIQNYAPNITTDSMSDALIKQKQQIDQMRLEVENLRTKLDEEEARRTSEVNKVESSRDLAMSAADESGKEKSSIARTKEEELEDKNQQIAELDRSYRQLVSEFDDYRNISAQVQKDLEGKIVDLKKINDRLREKVFSLDRVQFDQPDGLVQYVDHNSNRAYINLGSEDYLPEGMSFSVYKKSNDGVGQTATKGDIKASIEVIRIMGPHQAEVTIKANDIENPISKNDPIFTPLWTPGRKYNFSLVGIMDLDGDGTEDRQALRNLIDAAGAEVDNEVLPTGERVGDGLTVETKFLVKGEIPNPTDFPPETEERLQAEEVSRQFGKIKEEARLQGVRIVSLNDFLDFMGFTSSRRVFRPGEERPYNLRSGTPTVGRDRGAAATGNVSGSYNDRRQPRAPGSSTEQSFGGN